MMGRSVDGGMQYGRPPAVGCMVGTQQCDVWQGPNSGIYGWDPTVT